MKYRIPLGEIEIWTLRFDEQQCTERAVLSEWELQRAFKFRFEDDCRRFIQSRTFVRTVLGHYLDVAPAEVRFSAGQNGKPCLSADMKDCLAFNLSHCRSCAMLAVSSVGRIGIDVEEPVPLVDLEQLVWSVFAPDDASAILAFSTYDRIWSFWSGWTRKEAALKAVGVGLAIEPRRVRVPYCDNGPWRIQIPGDPARFDLVDVSRSGVVAAVVTDIRAEIHMRKFDLNAMR
jgi:4'-phosphopantetheinyl transferase